MMPDKDAPAIVADIVFTELELRRRATGLVELLAVALETAIDSEEESVVAHEWQADL